MVKFLALVEQLFEQYGYLVLLIGLPLDAIALPIPPGNTTLTYTGYLAYKRTLDLRPAWLAAFAGSALGVLITYGIGYRLGMPLVERFGKWLSMRPEHLEKTRAYYEKYGNRSLIVSFFLPGIRQFIGYFLGIIRVPFRIFALYAFIGAALWVTAFMSIGYAFGEQWQYILLQMERRMKYVLIAAGLILLAVILLKWRKRAVKKRAAERE
ncbi:DedA family protein [Paenibacillus sp. P25]|nr:DedA family protein [Paenibacillus sp. P25]